MTLLAAHIPFLFGALGSILMLISTTAVTVTGYHYLRAMETTQARVSAEKAQPQRAPRHH